MRLAALMVVHNEADRYLGLCLEALSEFCDVIRVLDDGSTDDTPEVLARYPKVEVLRQDERTFFQHEGQTRQKALEWAHAASPTHVIAVDADELVVDGDRLREFTMGDAWSLCMREVWHADSENLHIRQDGGWCEHPVPIMWKVRPRQRYRINNRALACGRAPVEVSHHRAVFTDVAIYHFGWACEPDRAARYERYAVHDGGKYHRNQHIESIMWPEGRVVTTLEPWTARQGWLDRANRVG